MGDPRRRDRYELEAKNQNRIKVNNVTSEYPMDDRHLLCYFVMQEKLYVKRRNQSSICLTERYDVRLGIMDGIHLSIGLDERR